MKAKEEDLFKVLCQLRIEIGELQALIDEIGKTLLGLSAVILGIERGGKE